MTGSRPVLRMCLDEEFPVGGFSCSSRWFKLQGTMQGTMQEQSARRIVGFLFSFFLPCVKTLDPIRSGEVRGVKIRVWFWIFSLLDFNDA